MRSSWHRRLAVAGLGAIGVVLLAASPAAAHGAGTLSGLPLPRWQFAWAIAAVVIIAFFAVGSTWRRPRLAAAADGRPFPGWARPVTTVLGVVLRVVGVVVYVVVVTAGLFGSEFPAANIAPIGVFITFWVGIQFVSMFLGDVWRVLSPFETLALVGAWARALVRRRATGSGRARRGRIALAGRGRRGRVRLAGAGVPRAHHTEGPGQRGPGLRRGRVGRRGSLGAGLAAHGGGLRRPLLPVRRHGPVGSGRPRRAEGAMAVVGPVAPGRAAGDPAVAVRRARGGRLRRGHPDDVLVRPHRAAPGLGLHRGQHLGPGLDDRHRGPRLPVGPPGRGARRRRGPGRDGRPVRPDPRPRGRRVHRGPLLLGAGPGGPGLLVPDLQPLRQRAGTSSGPTTAPSTSTW